MDEHVDLDHSLTIISFYASVFQPTAASSAAIARTIKTNNAVSQNHQFIDIHPSIHPSIHQSIHLSIHPSVRPSVRSFIHSFIHSSIHSLIHPSIKESADSFIHSSIFGPRDPS